MDYCNPAFLSLLAWMLSLWSVWSGLVWSGLEDGSHHTTFPAGPPSPGNKRYSFTLTVALILYFITSVCCVYLPFLNVVKLTDWFTDFSIQKGWLWCPNSPVFFFFFCASSTGFFSLLSIWLNSVHRYLCSGGMKNLSNPAKCHRWFNCHSVRICL